MSFQDWWGLRVGRGLATGVHKFDGRGELEGHRFHLKVTWRGRGSYWSMLPV